MELYNSITELPFSAFIDCRVNGFYQSLIISGTHSREALKAAWQPLEQQYNDIEEEEPFYQKTAILLWNCELRNAGAEEYIAMLKNELALQVDNKRVQEALAPIKRKVNDFLQQHLSFSPSCPTMYNAEIDYAEKLIKENKEDWEVSTRLFGPIKRVFAEDGVKRSTRYYHNMLKLAEYTFREFAYPITTPTYQVCDLIRRANIRYTELNKQNS